MLPTYKAILRDNRVEWIEQPPEQTHPVAVHITFLEEIPQSSLQERGRVMADALEQLATEGTFSSISDPVAWQREERHERGLPFREP